MRRAAAALAVLAIASAFTGCSSEPVYSTGTVSEYQGNFYSFAVSDDFTYTGESGIVSTARELTDFSFEGSLFNSLTASESVKHCTAEVMQEDRLRALALYDSYKKIETEELTGLPLEVRAIHWNDSWADKERSGSSVYYISCEDRTFELEAKYNKHKRSKVRAAMEDIISTVRYIGDYRLPDTPQTVTDDYFIVDHDSYWTGDYYPEEDNGTAREAVFHIAASDDLQKYATSVDIKVMSDCDHASAKEYADSKFDDHKDLIRYSETKRDTAGIGGVTAERFYTEYEDLPGYGRTALTEYYADLNDVVYRVAVRESLDDESLRPEVDKLLSGIHFSDLTDEQRKSLNEANAAGRTNHYSFNGMEFDLNRRFSEAASAPEEDSLKFSMNSPNITLYLRVDKNVGYWENFHSVEESLEKISYQGEYERTGTEIDGREAVLIRSVLSGRALWDIFIYPMNEDYTRFMHIEFMYSERSSEADSYIDQIINSIKIHL